MATPDTMTLPVQNLLLISSRAPVVFYLSNRAGSGNSELRPGQQPEGAVPLLALLEDWAGLKGFHPLPLP